MAKNIPYPPSVEKLIEEFAKLPGIGKRSAERCAFHILGTPRDSAMALALAIRDARKNLRACSRCFHIAEGELCAVCSDPSRDTGQICVTELPRDVIALEKADFYTGVYHVLQGRLSPAEGVGPDNIRVKELLGRLKDGVREVIIATRPSAEGDATAEYLSGVIAEKQPAVIVSRLARGLASGADFENAAASSLVYAFQGRRKESPET
ncbi:MAG: recombination mediator RecR [Planctomycetes bacterium]|nr:recombination mediator RecR [Planctomycetota bacterium]